MVTTGDLSGNEVPKRMNIGSNSVMRRKYPNDILRFQTDEGDGGNARQTIQKVKKRIKKKKQ